MADHRLSPARILALNEGGQYLAGVAVFVWIVAAVAAVFGYVPVFNTGHRGFHFRMADSDDIHIALYLGATFTALFIVWLGAAWYRAQRMVSRASEVTGRVAEVRNEAKLRQFYVRWYDSAGAIRSEWIVAARDALPIGLLQLLPEDEVRLLIDPARPDQPHLLAVYVTPPSTNQSA